MSGTWLAAVAPRLMREETFRMVMSPAIADLQFEAPGASPIRRAGHYARVWAAMARAVLHDLRHDARVVFEPTTLRSVWLPAIGVYVVMVTILCYRALGTGVLVSYVGRTERFPLPTAGDGLWPYAAGVVVGIGLLCLGYATAIVAFRLRGYSGRAVVVATLLLAATTLSAARLARPIADTGSIYLSAIAMRGHADPQTTPLSDVIATHVIPQRALRMPFGGQDITVGEEQARLKRVREAELTVNVLAFALVGFTLAGVRGWTLLARAVCLAAAWVVLDRSLPIFHMIVWPYGTPQPPRALATLPELFVIPIAACIALAVRPPRHPRRLAHGA